VYSRKCSSRSNGFEKSLSVISPSIEMSIVLLFITVASIGRMSNDISSADCKMSLIICITVCSSCDCGSFNDAKVIMLTITRD
jgi:hypothetical protein